MNFEVTGRDGGKNRVMVTDSDSNIVAIVEVTDEQLGALRDGKAKVEPFVQDLKEAQERGKWAGGRPDSTQATHKVSMIHEPPPEAKPETKKSDSKSTHAHAGTPDAGTGPKADTAEEQT